MNETYLTTECVCKTFHICRQTLDDWVKQGKLTRYKPAKRNLYKADEVKYLIENSIAE